VRRDYRHQRVPSSCMGPYLPSLSDRFQVPLASSRRCCSAYDSGCLPAEFPHLISSTGKCLRALHALTREGAPSNGMVSRARGVPLVTQSSTVAPIIREAQKAGATSLREIAAALNCRAHNKQGWTGFGALQRRRLDAPPRVGTLRRQEPVSRTAVPLR
jgi:hypothetical protein